MEHSFILCVDARFPGGTSSAVMSEIEALAERFSPAEVGILCIESGLFGPATQPNLRLAEALEASPFPVYRFDSGRGVYVDGKAASAPASSRTRRLHGRFLVVHNPHVALALGKLAGRLSADMALVVCHQPYLDGDGIPYFSLADMIGAAREIATEVRLVPIGQVVRDGFLGSAWAKDSLTQFDWPNTFNFSSNLSRQPGGTGAALDEHLVIGRHSRPEWAKWPENRGEFKEIYQHGKRRRVRFLGWGSYCADLFRNDIPVNWETLPFNSVDPSVFLRSIDLFIYYHHRNWVEGFGRTVPEAIAAGLPCILSPKLAPTFGGAGLYCPPDGVTELLARLDDRRGELLRWSTHIREIAAEAFGLTRIQDIYSRLVDLCDRVASFAGFADVESAIGEDQRRVRLLLDTGFAVQEQLGLTNAAKQAGPASDTGKVAARPEQPRMLQSRSTDFAIYMDTRSARSDLWRTIELAETLTQAGYAVSLVHVQTQGKHDLESSNPLLDQLSATIEIYGREGDFEPSFLEVRQALIMAGPQRLFDVTGGATFQQALRLVAPSVLVLSDRSSSTDWYKKAAASISLMTGCRPKWLLTGSALGNIDVPDAVEAPELYSFVAHRSAIARRDLVKHIVGRQTFRRGRIGLMDASQWQTSPVGCVENAGDPLLFAYSHSFSGLPADLIGNPNFHRFSAKDISLDRFLEKVDLVTYFPSDKPSDLMLIPLLRAIQAGVLTVVDASLKRHFGSLPVYSTVEALGSALDRLVSRPEQVASMALGKARDLALADLGQKALRRLLDTLDGGAAVPQPVYIKQLSQASVRIPVRPEVLFVSSNGVGLGHLTRLMAIARRLEHCDPVFVTMSQAFKIVEASGWPVRYLPFHEVSGCDVVHWNLWLQYELEQILSRRPAIRSLVFDGSNPYSGLVAAGATTDIRKIWIQRGMWRKGHLNEEHVRRGKHFDVIIEPSDIAESLSAEPVRSLAFDKVKTDPILLLDRDELLDRKAARSALGIPLDKKACLLQLGSGTNREIVSLLGTIIPILKQKGITPYIAEWLMGSEVPRVWPGVVYLRVYPLAKYFSAFDFSVSAAGYNSFHELISFEVPTIYVANDHQSMDDQAARARFAMQKDAAMWVLEEEVHRIGTVIDLIERDDVREMMKESCAALRPRNGAAAAARMIDALSTQCRTVSPTLRTPELVAVRAA